jgi:hypothetical protein
VEAKSQIEEGEAMKNYTKTNQTRTGTASQGNDKGSAACLTEVDLLIEELEEMIAPGRKYNHTQTFVRDAGEIELDVEELEEVIAPGRKYNHNQTFVRDAEVIELDVEELEEVIAPGKRLNHNETLVRDAEEIELDVEDLEEVIAPGVVRNHNETLVRDADEIELDVEELEEVIAPGRKMNHNETLVPDARGDRVDEASQLSKRAKAIRGTLGVLTRKDVVATATINPDFAYFAMSVRPSGIHRWGVFADERIPERRRVIEYTGERISHSEARRRGRSREYLFTLDKHWLVDGAVGGSGAELINHSCDPNLSARQISGHILYFSKRPIEPCEELTVDYGVAPEHKPVPCRCGSAKCRGTINVKVVSTADGGRWSVDNSGPELRQEFHVYSSEP